MNKKGLSEALSRKIDLDYAECLIVFEVVERYFLMGKEACLKTINDLVLELNVDEDKAVAIYDDARKIIKDGIKDLVKHPFSSKD